MQIRKRDVRTKRQFANFSRGAHDIIWLSTKSWPEMLVGTWLNTRFASNEKAASFGNSPVFYTLLVERHICLVNPALVAETERYQVVEGKTPKISARQIKQLLSSIPTDSPIGLRDKAAISIMIYTAARAGAVARLNISDYGGVAGERKLRFHEKGGKSREIAVRHDLEKTIDHYLASIGLSPDNRGPLFLAARRKEKNLSPSRLRENDMCRMVKRRMKKAGLPRELSAHSFRVATITDLIGQGIPIEDVQQLAGHKDARTTKLYDRTNRKVTRNPRGTNLVPARIDLTYD